MENLADCTETRGKDRQADWKKNAYCQNRWLVMDINCDIIALLSSRISNPKVMMSFIHFPSIFFFNPISPKRCFSVKPLNHFKPAHLHPTLAVSSGRVWGLGGYSESIFSLTCVRDLQTTLAVVFIYLKATPFTLLYIWCSFKPRGGHELNVIYLLFSMWFTTAHGAIDFSFYFFSLKHRFIIMIIMIIIEFFIHSTTGTFRDMFPLGFEPKTRLTIACADIILIS